MAEQSDLSVCMKGEHIYRNMTIRYTGPAYDPLEEGDALSARLVKGLCRSVSHGSICSEGFTNELILKLKQE